MDTKIYYLHTGSNSGIFYTASCRWYPVWTIQVFLEFWKKNVQAISKEKYLECLEFRVPRVAKVFRFAAVTSFYCISDHLLNIIIGQLHKSSFKNLVFDKFELQVLQILIPEKFYPLA